MTSTHKCRPLDGFEFESEGTTYACISMSTTAPALPHFLTEAERDIVLQMMDGKTTAGIAERRGTSKRTVDHQIERIFQKLGVRDRNELCERLFGTATEA